jgi:hypothetical protein
MNPVAVLFIAVGTAIGAIAGDALVGFAIAGGVSLLASILPERP